MPRVASATADGMSQFDVLMGGSNSTIIAQPSKAAPSSVAQAILDGMDNLGVTVPQLLF